MARYIDADKLWNNRPLIPEGKSQDYMAGFSECMWGFSEEIRKSIDNSTADVVPKSEVEELKAIIADHKANEERWQELYADTVDKWEKAYEELEIKLENAKTEVAREIFEEILNIIRGYSHSALVAKNNYGATQAEYIGIDILKLKKKYTEGKK